MGRSFAVWMLVLGVSGCEPYLTAPYPLPETASSEPSSSEPLGPAPDPYQPAASIEIWSYSRFDFPGIRRWFAVYARDAQGLATHSDRAVVTSSNPDVAIAHESVYGVSEYGNLPPYRQRGGIIEELAEGVTTIRATLGSLSTSFEVQVEPVPGPSTALVVDSFSVVEFVPECSFACPYVAYAPRLYLHEPAGTGEVSIEGVEVSIPTWSSGWCAAGSMPVLPGAVTSVFGLDPYLWNNDILHVSLDGTRVPDGPARARILTRDGLGRLGIVEAEGSIERNARPVYSEAQYFC